MRVLPVIREAASHDVPAVRALLTDARLVLEGLESLGSGLLVADQDGDVVGAVGLEVHGRDSLLRSLVVRPDLRGTGLGRRLTAAALAWARTRDLTVWLLTETAEPFFAAQGFTRVARDTAPPGIVASHEFAKACPASAAFMRYGTAA